MNMYGEHKLNYSKRRVQGGGGRWSEEEQVGGGRWSEEEQVGRKWQWWKRKEDEWVVSAVGEGSSG